MKHLGKDVLFRAPRLNVVESSKYGVLQVIRDWIPNADVRCVQRHDAKSKISTAIGVLCLDREGSPPQAVPS